MKILYLVTQADIGGAQVFVKDLSRAITTAGHTCTVGFGPTGNFLTEALDPDITQKRFQHLSRGFGVPNILFLFECIEYFRKERFDIIHCNSTNTLLAAYACTLVSPRTKVIFTFHGLSLLDPAYPGRPWQRRLYTVFFWLFTRFVDAAVFVSHRDALEAAGRIKLKHTSVIYNGIPATNESFLPKDVARTQLEAHANISLSDKSPIIGCIARMSYQKHLDALVPVMAQLKKRQPLPTPTLLIIGDGPERAALEAVIAQADMEEHIQLLGAMPQASQYMRAFDVLVLPSRYEGLPITLIESLFARIPAVVSNIPGNKEVLGQIGTYAAPDDVSAFANAVGVALTNQHSHNYDKQAAKFTMTSSAAQYLALYTTTLN